MRSTLIFIAGVAAAMALTHATVAIASCFQPSEYASLHLASITVNDEPAAFPEDRGFHSYEIAATGDGVQLNVYDRQGYLLGSETYLRRMP